jgi:hypothetical protein
MRLLTLAFTTRMLNMVAATPCDETVELGSWAYVVALCKMKLIKDFFFDRITMSFKETLAIVHVFNHVFGCDIGEGTEIDYCEIFTEKSLRTGKDCQLNGGSIFGFPTIANGYLATSTTQMGDRAFTGNFAVLTNGSVMGDASLIGMHTGPPSTGNVAPGAVIFGSPPLMLPPRPELTSADINVTFEPSCAMVWLRCVADFLKIILVQGLQLTITVSCVFLSGYCTTQTMGVQASAVYKSSFEIRLDSTLLVFMAFGLSIGYVMSIAVFCAGKWATIGRYTIEEVPLYSCRMFMLSIGYKPNPNPNPNPKPNPNPNPQPSTKTKPPKVRAGDCL